MRTAFIDELCALAAEDESVWLLCGDLGYSVLERFRDRFPERFVNVGVAEQNMIGVAAGLAHTGKTVWTYSIGNFATLRCLEQIRNDVCYHGLNVKVVAVGGGMTYGTLGYSHHALEDLAILRALPGLDVVAPADPWEARLAVRSLLETQGPAYLRLGRAGEPEAHTEQPTFARGTMLSVREGSDALLITTGGLLVPALEAAQLAAEAGTSLAVWSCPWLVPFDADAVASASRSFPVIVTAEEGVHRGGLGGAVAEVLAGLPGEGARLVRLGTGDQPLRTAHSQSAARRELGLDGPGLLRRVLALLRGEDD